MVRKKERETDSPRFLSTLITAILSVWRLRQTLELRSRTHVSSLRFRRTKKIIGRALTCMRALHNGTRSDSVISECRRRRVQQWCGNANVSRQLLDCVLLFALYEPGPRIQSPTFTKHSRSLARANRLFFPSLSSPFSPSRILYSYFYSWLRLPLS